MNSAHSTNVAEPVASSPAIAPPIRGLLWALWLIALGLGLVGVYQRWAMGHLPAGYGSFVPWGLWVAIYFHGVGIAGGAFLLGAGGFLLGLPGFRNPATLRMVIVLSVAAVIPAFLGVWLDLGHMERAAYIFLFPNFNSMMTLNAWMYTAFMILAAVCWFLTFQQRSAWLKPLLAPAILFSIMFPSQSGAFFGVVEAKGFWHSALLPMLFLASAITAGSAALLAVRVLLGPGAESAADHEAAIRRLRTVTLIGLAVYFVFEFAEFSIALWNPEVHAPAIELILHGPLLVGLLDRPSRFGRYSALRFIPDSANQRVVDRCHPRSRVFHQRTLERVDPRTSGRRTGGAARGFPPRTTDVHLPRDTHGVLCGHVLACGRYGGFLCR